MSTLRIVPCSFKEAKWYIELMHRHNPSLTGWKFGVRLTDESNNWIGVATAGRPVARHFDDGFTLEVNRTCTDGTRNANSMLYGAIWRAAKALGYSRCITYTQAEETGASLRAVGWLRAAELAPRGSWAESTANPVLKAARDPVGNGGVQRVRWEIRSSN